MTGGRPASAALTDRQLGDLVRFIARMCLEVERGLRPAAHLLRVMDPATAQRWRHPGHTGRFRAGPVQGHDIGPPHIIRFDHDRVGVTVVTRTHADRWGALTFRLRVRDGRWHVSGLQRLLAGAHYRTRPVATVAADLPPQDLPGSLAKTGGWPPLRR